MQNAQNYMFTWCIFLSESLKTVYNYDTTAVNSPSVHLNLLATRFTYISKVSQRKFEKYYHVFGT